MAAWPVSLPTTPRHDGGFRQDPINNVVRSQMDEGETKTRQRFTKVTRNASFNMIMTDAQVATLKTFHETTLNGGADEFTFTDFVAESAATCRFTSPPSYTYQAPDVWNVALAMEVGL